VSPDDKARALALCPVSRETEDRLQVYVELLLHWHRRIDLIAPSTIPTLWTRHIADSLQLLRFAAGAGDWVDIGSGAGLPGLVVAIAAPKALEVWLVEPNQKRCAFLREAARETGANARIIPMKLEQASRLLPSAPDIVSARAVAPLRALLGLAAPLLKTGGLGVFPKGQDVESELTEASKYWRFKATLTASLTEPKARIVTVSNLSPLSDLDSGR